MSDQLVRVRVTVDSPRSLEQMEPANPTTPGMRQIQESPKDLQMIGYRLLPPQMETRMH